MEPAIQIGGLGLAGSLSRSALGSCLDRDGLGAVEITIGIHLSFDIIIYILFVVRTIIRITIRGNTPDLGYV